MTVEFVICGLEHSGTTLMSDIFRQVDNLDSGFEVGVLLADSPRDFSDTQPFFKNMIGGWELEESDLNTISQTDSFKDFYEQLKAHSNVIDSDIRHIFDKTPRYFLDVLTSYEKIKVPFICMYKDPRSLVYSDYKRSGKGQDFDEWYESYKKPKLRYLENVYNNSYLKCKQGKESTADIMCISLENVCLDTRNTLEKIFAHVNYEFKVEYLLLKNLRYQHTRQPQISSRIPFEYLEGFTAENLSRIEEDFAILADWFYS